MDISAIISGLTYAQTLAGLLAEERDTQKQAALKSDLMEKITATQAKLAEVLAVVLDQQATIKSLTDRCNALEASNRLAERYRLEVVGTLGAMAYRLKGPEDLPDNKDEAPHYLCQVCFDSGRKSVLQPSPNGRLLHCKVEGGHDIRTAESPPPTNPRRTYSAGWNVY